MKYNPSKSCVVTLVQAQVEPGEEGSLCVRLRPSVGFEVSVSG